MTVSRDTHPTHAELLAFWEQVAPVRVPLRHRRPSRLMLIAWCTTICSIAAIYAALLWAIQAVGH